VIEKLTPGGPAALSEVVVHDEKKSAFFLRLVERREPRVPAFEAIEDTVKKSYFTGLDEELRQYYTSHSAKYKTPETFVLEHVFVPYAKFEKAVPAEVTGTARAGELRKKAEELFDELRKDAGKKADDGKTKDLETVALDRGVEHGRATTDAKGKDLAAGARAAEGLAHLEQSGEKTGELSSAFENDAKTGLVAYLVKGRKPEVQLTFAEAKERVRKDVLAERAFERAKEAAEAFAKEAEAKPSEFRAIAEKRAQKVAETGFVDRKATVEGLPGSSALVSAIFGAQEVGEVAGPAQDAEARVSFVLRYLARKPADPAGFAAKEKELRDGWEVVARFGGNEALRQWEQKVRLRAHGVGDEVLKEVYDLRYGPDGLAEVEAGHIFVAPDAATIEQGLEAKAHRDALATLADIRAGAKFEELARKRSQDTKTRRRGGDLGYFAKGRMVPEFEAAAFALKPGEVSEPVKSKFGWHLIQLVDRKGDEVRARHILFKNERGTDEAGKELPLDPETRKAAMAKSLEKAQKAEARLKAGEDFASVAKDASDEPGSADKRTYEFETPFERAALGLGLGEMSDVMTFREGTFDLLYTQAARDERDERGRPGASKARAVRRIEGKDERGRKKLQQIREELMAKTTEFDREEAKDRERTGYASEAFRKAFEDYAREESEAASGAAGGRIGVVRPDEALERFGPAFRDALYTLKEGETSGIIEGREGFHLVKVVKRVKKTFTEARQDAADLLLEGLEF